jgi:hypothetical protein
VWGWLTVECNSGAADQAGWEQLSMQIIILLTARLFLLHLFNNWPNNVVLICLLPGGAEFYWLPNSFVLAAPVYGITVAECCCCIGQVLHVLLKGGRMVAG